MNIPENKDFYVTILDGINTGVWAVDKNEKFIFFNSAMERISGLKKSQTIGSNLMTDIPEQTMNGEAQFRKLFLNVKKSLETTSYGPIPIITPKGDLSYQSGVLTPQFDENEQYDGMMCTVDDITEHKLVEKALQDSKLRLIRSQKIAHMGDWEYVIETNKYMGSEECYRIFDIDPAIELSYELLQEMTHPDDRDISAKHTKNLIMRGIGEPFEHRIVRPDGSIRHVYAQGEVARDGTGKIVKLFGIMLDITERKRAEKALQESERKLLRAQKVANVGDWEFDIENGVIDIENGVNMWSDELYQIYGFDPADKIDLETMLARIHLDDRDYANEMMMGWFKNGYGEPLEYRVVRPDGSTRHIYSPAEVVCDSDGNVVKAYGIVLDITDRKNAEKSLKIYAEELAKSNEELKSLDTMKNDFLSNVSHELKTPLMSIKGFSEVMQNELYGPLNDQQKKAMDTVVRNCKRLDLLINSILYLTVQKAGRDTYTFVPVNMSVIIDNSIIDISPQFNSKELTIEQDIAPDLLLINGDMDKLAQVFTNLIENAVKFTHKGGKITVKAYNENENVHITVNDTGIGISNEVISNLFDKFYQVDASTTRRYGGIGIGLHISKLIIEVHNGEIWAESEDGVGTTFHVTLPK